MGRIYMYFFKKKSYGKRVNFNFFFIKKFENKLHEI